MIPNLGTLTDEQMDKEAELIVKNDFYGKRHALDNFAEATWLMAVYPWTYWRTVRELHDCPYRLSRNEVR